jgi:hypothetical protein
MMRSASCVKVNIDDIISFTTYHQIMIWISNLPILSVPAEGYSRYATCALNLIFTFLTLEPMETFEERNMT